MRRVAALLAVIGIAVVAVVVLPSVAVAQAPETTTTTAPDPAAVATRAVQAWSPPAPQIRTNPPAERAQVAGLPTWLWVEPQGPLVFTATDGPTTVSLEARPASVRFDFGDGTSLTCTGRGRPYDPAVADAAQSSDCTHAFVATSGGGTMAVHATVTWALTHEGRPIGTLQSSSEIDVAVADAQGLDRRPEAMSGAEAGARPDVRGEGRALSELDELAPKKDDRSWWEKALDFGGDVLGGARNAFTTSQEWMASFGGDIVAGSWDAIKGLAHTAWLSAQTNPLSPFALGNAIFNWDGYTAAWKELAGGVVHTVTHPWELAGIDDIANGKPGRAVPDILLLLLPIKGAKGLKPKPVPKPGGSTPRPTGGGATRTTATDAAAQAGKSIRPGAAWDVTRATELAAGSRYGALDELGRPTGIHAHLTPEDINTGTPVPNKMRPPGFGGKPAGHARGHLLGRQLGGSGTDPRNVVTLYQTPANSPVMRGFENKVRTALEEGQVVDYKVTPIYRGSDPVPVGITMEAKGSGGLDTNVTVLNRGADAPASAQVP